MPIPRSGLVPLVALAAALSGCEKKAEAPPPDPLSVVVVSAKTTRVSDVVTLTGSLQARVQSDLSFRIAGRIAARLVEVGDRVSAGQVLARLETPQQEADVAAARAGLAAAEATLKQSTATFDRQRTLIDGGFTTRSQYDNANQAMLSARAELASRHSALDTALDSLRNTELRADAPGIITARNGEAGQVVDVAQPIYTLAHDGRRDAVLDVYESLLVGKPDDPAVAIALLSDPSVRTTGRVREIAPAINPSTGTVRVKVALDDTPAAMGLGAAVSGSGSFRSREVVALPAGAFFARGRQASVWVVEPGTNAVAERPVEIDSFRTGALLLRGGIRAGELVVVAGGQFLRPELVVTPVLENGRSAGRASE